MARTRITERDRELLGFLAEQRVTAVEVLMAFLSTSRAAANGRLRALVRLGLLERHRVFDGESTFFQITSRGLDVLGSTIAAPRLDLRSYRHDLGVASLTLAARQGSFGPVREVLPERVLRSRDTVLANAGEQRFAVRLGGTGPGGRERLHYPDLLVMTSSGHRVAIELELSGKGITRRERILAGYAADPRIDAILYLVQDRGLARQLAASARRLGISRIVHVQPVRLERAAAPGPAGGPARRRPEHRVEHRPPQGAEVGR